MDKIGPRRDFMAELVDKSKIALIRTGYSEVTHQACESIPQLYQGTPHIL